MLQHQPGMHAAFVGGSAIQMQDLQPTYVNAQKTPLYNSHRIDGLPKKTSEKCHVNVLNDLGKKKILA